MTEPIAGVAMVFQHFGLFPWKTVFDNVAYGLRMAGAPKADIDSKVPEFIKLVGLAGFEKAFPYQMSGGMQQRCGLARALAVEPNVLLMDEPFAAVDAQTREILQFELLRIWEERPTAMIFVTHSIEEAVLLGHRVIVLKGRPSSIHETIDIDLPHPRTRETLREPRFAELRERVWGTLMREARAAEFELRRLNTQKRTHTGGIQCFAGPSHLTAGAACLSRCCRRCRPAAAQGKKLIIALPGIPPIFSVTLAYVAEKQGFFKKHGVNVEIRPFDNGTAAARAVVAGDIDMSWSPTPPVINQVSNADVPLVAHLRHAESGLGHRHDRDRQDLQGSRRPGSRRRFGRRRAVGRAALDARWRLQGREYRSGQAGPLGSSSGPAMLAGRLQYAVLHLDDLAEIQHQGKKLNILLAMKNTNPTSHYLVLVARKDKLASQPRRLRARGRRHGRGRALHAGPEERRRGRATSRP